MRILAIETATAVGSVALLKGGELIREATRHVPQRHLEWLAPAVAELLESSGWRPEDVEALAVSVGPGSFTGVRIGLATATAWARARNVPIAAVSTLEALAEGLSGRGRLCPVLDARRGEIAFALFERAASLVRLTEDVVGPPEALLTHLRNGAPLIVGGDGVPRISAALRDYPQVAIAPPTQWSPRAACTGLVAWRRLSRGERDDPYRLRPVYGRGAGMTPSPWIVVTEEGEGNSATAGEE